MHRPATLPPPAANEQFDVVLALEVVEHVSDVPALVHTMAQRVVPGGLLVAFTIDRSWKRFVFAIVGAEYVLRVLPRGTRRWQRFVRPTELAAAAAQAGQQQQQGMRCLPGVHRASWCADTRLNVTDTHAAPPGV